MIINHVAIWAINLNRLKDFYCLYFDAKAGSYISGFSSYFLSFDSGARLELMQSIHMK